MREESGASIGAAHWIAEAGAHQDGAAPPARKSPRSDSAALTRIDLTRMERAIDLRRLRYFVNIVVEGSFSLAAERVCVAQPALSHHVRELEAVLGVRLLTRSAHGVAMTEAGRCLYEHALRILASVGDAAAEVSAFNIGAPPQVRVGLDSTAASMAFVPLIEAVRLRDPGVLITIEEGSGADVCKWIEGRRLDIGLLLDPPESKTLLRRALLTERLCLIGPPGTEESEINFSEAARLPLIAPLRGNRLRDRLDRVAKAANIALNVVIEVDGVSSAKKLVRAGLGRSVLSAADVEDECSLGLLQKRAIVGPRLEQTLTLCTARGGKASRATLPARRLISQVVEELFARSGQHDGRADFDRSMRPAAIAFA
jgi:LysR family transcriptional regulator, nitrogen assimilation regulatory protein